MSVRDRVRVGIVGATGYSGTELLRILNQHPGVAVTYVSSSKDAADDLTTTHPYLYEARGLRLQQYDSEACAGACDVVFAALPSGVSGSVAAELWQAGKTVIDLSGDLRLPAAVYREWYNKPPVDETVRAAAVYGLTEWHRQEIGNANLLSNPGCYATAALLALKPLAVNDWIEGPVLIDAKSGVSGAGKGPALNQQLSELAENFYPYKVGRHQHTPEIEQELGLGEENPVLMTTQLLPIVRGIYSVAYVKLRDAELSMEDILPAYQARYRDEPFIYVHPVGQIPELKHVRGSNRCHLGLHLDERTNTLLVFSAVDNLQKGASGQAVQNLNRMMGWAETEGLLTQPLYP